MKGITLIKIALVCFFGLGTGLSAFPAVHLWVSPTGNDRNSGSVEYPLATLRAACRQARECRRLGDPAIQGGIYIHLKGGIYYLTEPLMMTPEDGGTAGSPTWIEAAPGERPVISGGIPIDRWQPVRQSVTGLQDRLLGKIWVTDCLAAKRWVPFRQLWVNGQKRVPARNQEGKGMMRILSVDYVRREISIPDVGVSSFSRPDELELFLHQWWEVAVLRVERMRKVQGGWALHFQEPESRIEFEHPWPPPVVSAQGNSVARLSGAIELLDEPGEWYFDRSTGLLYYYPVEGEDMARSEVVVPQLETLLTVQGTPERPVKQLHWKGITFAYAGWNRPSIAGYVPLQAGMFLLDAYKLAIPGTPDKATLENQAWIGRQPAAVQLRYAVDMSFEACRFQHIGASALDLTEGDQRIRVEGCLLNEIAGSGVVAGCFSDLGVETHRPYDPTDPRVLCHDLVIRNNLLEDIANEYWGCVGILAGYVRDVTIEYNTLRELSYSGISVGWGWTSTVNILRNNRIHANRVERFGKTITAVGAFIPCLHSPELSSREMQFAIYTTRLMYKTNKPVITSTWMRLLPI